MYHTPMNTLDSLDQPWPPTYMTYLNGKDLGKKCWPNFYRLKTLERERNNSSTKGSIYDFDDKAHPDDQMGLFLFEH